MPSLAERLAERIQRHGPLPYETFVEAALYDPEGGFYASGGMAGRRGDFLTSPEVGPLFGAVLARALDAWWDELGRPDPYVVVDAGAGPGTLARAILVAAPACAPALRYVLVERSAAQRQRHAHGLPLVPPAEAFAGLDDGEPSDDDAAERASGDDGAGPVRRGPLAVSLAEMPTARFTGVILANELLDNLPFGLVVWDGAWREARVGLGTDGRFVEVLVPLSGPDHGLTDALARLPRPALGARAPRQAAALAWLRDALDLLAAGRVVVVDYMTETVALAAQPWRDWLRTYRDHAPGTHPLDAPGTQDITTEVALDQLARLRPPDAVRAQAQFLALHGLHELVEEGRRVWQERASIGDLAALTARSRVRESEALADPSGLGAFTVAEWLVR